MAVPGTYGAAIGASAGMDLLAGLFGFLGGGAAQETADSRARMIRMDAEADAQRYAEQAQGFKATQKLAFLKSGVTLSGSPLDILDETARVTRENLSAIRARGEAGATDAELEGLDAKMKGRAALIGAGFKAMKTAGVGAYQMSKNSQTARTPRNSTYIGGGVGYAAPAPRWSALRTQEPA